MSDEQDALDAQYALPVLVIQLSRVYDALMALIRLSDDQVFGALLEAHSDGKLLGPPPIYNMEEE